MDDWSAAPAALEGLPVRLCAAEGEVAIDLRLARGKPPVPHGDRGLSQKSAEPSVTGRGAVEARGTAYGLPVTGRDYLELTGYADG